MATALALPARAGHTHTHPHTHGRQGTRTPGFTLVECMVVCAIVGLLGTLLLAASQQRALRIGRMDAVDALTRIQHSQEQYRALHGMYSDNLAVLRSASAQSAQGRYQLQLQRNGGESYTAFATAQGLQHTDHACPVLTLSVDQGYPQAGPSAACWNR